MHEVVQVGTLGTPTRGLRQDHWAPQGSMDHASFRPAIILLRKLGFAQDGWDDKTTWS